MYNRISYINKSYIILEILSVTCIHDTKSVWLTVLVLRVLNIFIILVYVDKDREREIHIFIVR